MKALKLAALGVALVLAAAAVLTKGTALREATPATPTPEAAQTAAAPAPTAPSPVTAACTFTPGQRFAYAASVATSWTLPERLRSLVGALSDGNSSWSAELHFEVLSAGREGAVLLGRLSDATQAFAQGGGEGLTTSWLARVDSRCEVVGFARHASTPVQAARVQQAALHELWFTVPDAETAGFDFLNATGQARGVMAKEGGALVRRIESYPRTWSRDMAGLKVTGSSLAVERGKGPWFDSMTGLETFTAGSIDRGKVELSIVSTDAREDVLAKASRKTEEYVWENLLGPVVTQTSTYVPVDHQQRVEAMRSTTLAGALQRFTAAADTDTNVAAQWPDMAAFLDAHPESIEDFSTLLVTEFEPKWKAGGFIALGQTQNPAAREALLGIWRERGLSMMDRTRSSLVLATRADVGAAFAQELRAESTRTPGNASEANVSRQAMLHLGILAGTRISNQEVLAEARAAMRGALGSAKTPDETSLVFAAIGNTGDVTFLPEVERWSRHADPGVRATVAIGMRRMPVDAVRDFTLDWLRRETHPDVKREIFEVMQHQYQDEGRVLDEALVDEAVRHLRQQPRILTRQSLFRLLEPHLGNESVRAAMREQLKVEYESRTGLFAFVASTLGERDVQSVLASMPSLRDQLGNVSPAPPSPRAVADAVESAPDWVMPAPPTAADVEGTKP